MKHLIILSIFYTSAAFSLNKAEVSRDKSDLPAHENAKEMDGIGVDEHLGGSIDLGLKFKDELGQDVTLGNYFDGTTPVLMAMVYYNCPNLCNLHMNAMTKNLRKMKWQIGKEFKFVVVSINPKETPNLAMAKKETYLDLYGKKDFENGWSFLTGDQDNITKLATQLGFKYRYDATEDQYYHSAVAYTVTPEGTISRYLYGLDQSPKFIRLSLVEASENKVGTIMDKIVLFCMTYNPSSGKYTPAIFRLVQVLAFLMMTIVGFFLYSFYKSEKKKAL